MWLSSLYRNVLLMALLLLLLVTTGANSRHPSESELRFAQKVPAVQLMPNWSEPITFATVTIYQGRITDVDHHSTDTFIRIYSGSLVHRYNPDGIDYFDLHDIPNCAVEFDTIFNTSKSYCSALSQLWKLRYQKNPRTYESGGWARKGGAPDEAQLIKLKAFGIERLNDFSTGDDMWLLLQSVTDPSWQSMYR